MTSQKMYVYFRHGKFENYSPRMTEWLLNTIDDIDPQLSSLEEKKKTWNNGEVYGKQKATDQLRIQLVADQQCTNGQNECSTN